MHVGIRSPVPRPSRYAYIIYVRVTSNCAHEHMRVSKPTVGAHALQKLKVVLTCVAIRAIFNE